MDPVKKDRRAATSAEVVATRLGETCMLKTRVPSARRKPRPAITVADFQTLAIGGLVAAGASTKTLGKASRVLSIRAKDRAREKFCDGLRRFFDGMGADEAQDVLAEHERAKARQLAYYSLDGRADWRPRLTLEGAEQIQEAFARGRGVILWGDNFLPRVLVGKRALEEHGVRASQVSVPTHGFPETRFASRFIHPMQVAAEDRHCGDRIVFDPDARHGVKDRIEARLGEGQAILLTNNVHAGRRFVEIPLRPGVTLEIARGPIDLALKTGAALLPYVTIETDPFSDFRSVVGSNLIREDRAHSDAPVVDAAMAYRDWLTPFLKAYPAQWVNWARVLGGVE